MINKERVVWLDAKVAAPYMCRVIKAIGKG